MTELRGPHRTGYQLSPYWGLIGLVVIGGGLAAASSVQSYLQNAERRQADTTPKVQIKTVLQDQGEAWNRGDLDGFMAGYWDSPELEFISGTTTTHGFQPTKQRYFKRYKAEGKEMGTLTFSDIAVSVLGETDATATGKWKLAMTHENPGGGFTLTLKKFESGWKIVKDVTTSDEPPKK